LRYSDVGIWRLDDNGQLCTANPVWQLDHTNEHLLSAVALSHNGSIAASGSWDRKTVRVWRLLRDDNDLPITESIFSFDHDDLVNSIALSADGTTVASGSDDNTVCVWQLGRDPQDATMTRVLGHTDAVNSIALSADGAFVASGSNDETLRVWRLRRAGNQNTTELLCSCRHDDSVNSVALSADGTIVASGSQDKTVRVWRLLHQDDGHVVAELVFSYSLHGPIFSVALSESGNTVVCGSWDETVRVWRLDTSGSQRPAELFLLRGHRDSVDSVALSADGLTLVSGAADDVRVWRLDKLHQPSDMPVAVTLRGQRHPVTAVALSADGSTLVSRLASKAVRMRRLDENSQSIAELDLKLGRSTVNCVAISANGEVIACGSLETGVSVWQQVNGQLSTSPVRSLQLPSEIVQYVALSADGKIIASEAFDGTIHVWWLDGITDDQPVPETEKDSKFDIGRYSAALSTDGTTVARGSGKTVRVWPLRRNTAATENPPFVDLLNNSAVASVALSADGLTIASGLYDGTVTVWQLDRSDQPVGDPVSLLGHSDMVSAVSLSGDGKTVASLSEDGTVRLWCANQPNVDPILLCDHKDTAISVALSADGTTVAIGMQDGSARIARSNHTVYLRQQLFHLLQNNRPDDILAFARDHPDAIRLPVVYKDEVKREVVFDTAAMRLMDEHDGDVDTLLELLKICPDLLLLPSPACDLKSPLDVAIERGARNVVEAFVNHMQAQKTIQHRHLWPLTNAIGFLCERFPDIAMQVLARASVPHARDSRPFGKAVRRVDAEASADTMHERVSADAMQEKASIATDATSDTTAPAAVMPGKPVQKPGLAVPLAHRVVALPGLVSRTALEKAAPPGYTKLVTEQRRSPPRDPLERIVASGNVDLFRTSAMAAVLDLRWNGIRTFFWFHAALYAVFLFCFCFNTVYIATESLDTPLSSIYSTSSLGRARATLAVLGLVLNLCFLVFELVEVCIVKPLAYGKDFWNWINVGGHVLVFVLAPLHLLRDPGQYPVAAVAAVLLWYNLLMFSRGFPATGVFTSIMFEMVKECWGLLLIFVVVIAGFANAYLLLFRGTAVEYAGFWVSLVSLFDGAVSGLSPVFRDNDDKDFRETFEGRSGTYNLQLALFVAFMLIVNVMLLNLLIALMSSVYDRVSEKATAVYRWESAKLLLMLERLFPVNEETRPWLHVTAPVDDFSDDAKLIAANSDDNGTAAAETAEDRSAGVGPPPPPIAEILQQLLKETERTQQQLSELERRIQQQHQQQPRARVDVV
jgi:WD40 repeat protein